MPSPSPKWFEDDAKSSRAKKTVLFGRNREKAIIGAIGGQATPRSGAGRTKGDARKARYHIEIKATRHKSFSITRTILDKLFREAGHARTPLLVVELNDRKRPEAFVVMPLDEFQTLTGMKVTL